MIRTILVPLDGSAVAEQGLVAARRIAKETGATLLLVRAVVYFGVEETSRENEARDLRDARAYLDRIEQDLIAQGFSVATEVLPVDPVRAILFTAEAHDVDMISICTHGGAGLRRVVLGSIAEAVLRQSRVPILLTHAGAQQTQPGEAPFGTILVALDGTDFAESGLAYLRREGIGRSAKLVLLRAVAPVPIPFAPTALGDGAVEALDQAERETEERRLATEGYLRGAGAALSQGCPWQARAVLGEPGEAILRTAEREGVELIAIATHDRHGWERLLHGSVTRHLVHHANMPLLILRGPATAVAAADASASNDEAAIGGASADPQERAKSGEGIPASAGGTHDSR